MVQAKKVTTEEKVKKTTKSVKTEKVVAAKKTAVKPVEKKIVAKPVVKKESVESTVKVETKKPAKQAAGGLTIDVYDISGKVTGQISLPEALFGEKVNKELLAQAIRVYLANKRQGNASTKTRGEVDGSSRKIYRQKGTGRARHGSIRAPIFVHGGIVHGPKPRDYSLEMPKKMRRKALFSALSAKLQDGDVKVISGLEAISPKTKEFLTAVTPLELDKKSVLLVLPGAIDNVLRAARNVPGISMTAARQLNAYDVLKAKHLLVMKDSIAEMEKTFLS